MHDMRLAREWVASLFSGVCHRSLYYIGISLFKVKREEIVFCKWTKKVRSLTITTSV
jgi:hypothetical protein